ncbi:MAG: sporulation protein [Ruminococcaceae bacterium]|nr:sporulation protein [Oscillospiraceae bacterium]MBQ8324887.1 sporulation protein [Clostridia bacterium]
MNSQTPIHGLTLTDRRVLKITAVTEVISFDENNVSMSLGDSVLNVSGTELSVSSLSLENGEVTLLGNVDAIVYLDDLKPRKRGLGRFFGA